MFLTSDNHILQTRVTNSFCFLVWPDLLKLSPACAEPHGGRAGRVCLERFSSFCSVCWLALCWSSQLNWMDGQMASPLQFIVTRRGGLERIWMHQQNINHLVPSDGTGALLSSSHRQVEDYFRFVAFQIVTAHLWMLLTTGLDRISGFQGVALMLPPVASNQKHRVDYLMWSALLLFRGLEKVLWTCGCRKACPVIVLGQN